MAEFCLECMNKYEVTKGYKLKRSEVLCAEDLCEYCGKIKPCVSIVKRRAMYKLHSDEPYEEYPHNEK